jgi:hypothetical protein
MVQEGKIKSYGISSQNAFLLDPIVQGLRNGVAATEFFVPQFHHIIKLAEKAGGTHHNFKFLQMPFSLLSNQAWTLNYQTAKESVMTQGSNKIEKVLND